MKKVVKKHSKSHLPRAIRDLCRWKVVAVKKGDGRHVKWLPTEDCDFHPLAKIHTAIRKGEVIAAQHRVEKWHYELWVQSPRTGKNIK